MDEEVGNVKGKTHRGSGRNKGAMDFYKGKLEGKDVVVGPFRYR